MNGRKILWIINRMKLIFSTQFGSHIYGTNISTSDHDYKSVYIPAAEDILLQKVNSTLNSSTKKNNGEKNSKDDIDNEIISYQQYLKLLMEGQTMALDMLFTPEEWYKEKPRKAWLDIVDNRKYFLHKGIYAFVGYCRQQANKYGVKGSRVASIRSICNLLAGLSEKHGHLTKLFEIWDDIEEFANTHEHCQIISANPVGSGRNIARMLDVCNRKVQEFITIKEAIKIYDHIFEEYGNRALAAEKQEGIDWKALMHAVRVCYEVQELLLNHKITFPRPEAELLLKIRQGLMPYQEVAEIIEDGFIKLEEAQKISILPDKPNYDLANELVIKWYKHQIIIDE